ncbi:hypothetical protein L3X38_015315 [Prunus dulcis]|uniref:Uncharacterized protein n=1 Tax=Prunus dulcis TaxID=3755 RepID=A0AAD4ZJ49_PRUDU|nr:hypothetical protein L3X38_015315 [Prunus dulcis]
MVGQGMMGEGEGESPSLVVFRCGTPLALLRVVTCGNASLDKVMTSQSMTRGCSSLASCSVSYGTNKEHETYFL